jgi:hypothetical protein
MPAHKKNNIRKKNQKVKSIYNAVTGNFIKRDSDTGKYFIMKGENVSKNASGDLQVGKNSRINNEKNGRHDTKAHSDPIVVKGNPFVKKSFAIKAEKSLVALMNDQRIK